MRNINTPQGRILARFLQNLQGLYRVSLDLFKGLWSYGGFKLTVSGYPQIFSAP